MTRTEESDKYNEIILQPYNYLLANCGKQFRDKLIQAFNHWLDIPEDKLAMVKQVVELLHNASLLIDDIEDDSELRRGVPVAHKVYGVGHTLNTGNYCYFLALEVLLKAIPEDKSAEAVNLFTNQLLDLHRGQGNDIYWRDHFVCPTEEEYLDMIRKKSGGLFGLGIKLMQLFSDKDYDFTELVDRLSEFFQIRDDYANLVSDEYKESKTFAEDITEGKFSYPMIYAIKNHPKDTYLLDILRKRTTDINIKKYAVKQLQTLGAFDYTMKKLKALDEEVTRIMNEFGKNHALDQVVGILRDVGPAVKF